MRNQSIVCVALAALCMSTTLGAQIPMGALSSLGQAVIRDGQNQLLFKERLNQSIPPAAALPIPAGGSARIPVYRTEAILGPALGAVAEIDAISTGNDIWPMELQGGTWVVDPNLDPVLSWAALSFSVAQPDPGELQGFPGSILAQRYDEALQGQISADLFTYWVAENQGLETGFSDTTTLAVRGEHVQLPTGSDIRAFDTWLPILRDTFEERTTSPVRVWQTLFFSITEDSAEFIRAGQNWPQYGPLFTIPGSSPPPVTQNMITGATVFRVQSSNAGTPSQPNYEWGPIEIVVFPDEVSSTQGADIDALSVADEVMFSLTADTTASGESQLMALRPGVPGSRGPVVNANGFEVARRATGGPDADINGTCGIDPELVINAWFGTPVDNASLVATSELGLSVCRYPRRERPLLPLPSTRRQARGRRTRHPMGRLAGNGATVRGR